MDGFTLDPRLAADTIAVGDLELCAVRLIDDSRFPWLVLVPRRAGLSEITDLTEAESTALMAELRLCVTVMSELSKPDKVNVGALGNIVSQLHLHVVGRFLSDPAWPGPVWGSGDPVPYPHHAATLLVERAAQLFAQA